MHTITRTYMKYKGHPGLALLIIRIALGAIFIAHGWLKLQTMPATIGFFAFLGFSPFWAYLVTYVEFIGGIAVILGVFTRLAGFLLSMVMIVAMYFMLNLHVTFLSMANGVGYELNVAILAMSLAVMLSGSGLWALEKTVITRRMMGGAICDNCDICKNGCNKHEHTH